MKRFPKSCNRRMFLLTLTTFWCLLILRLKLRTVFLMVTNNTSGSDSVIKFPNITNFQRFMSVNCDDYGRLGNKMSQYATLMANSRYYNYRPVMTEYMGHTLRDDIFPHLSIPTMEEDKFFNKSTKFEHMKFIQFENDLRLRETTNLNIFFTGYPSDMKKFRYMFDELRREFKFETTYQDKANAYLNTVKMNYLDAKNLHDAQITFVGMHARRTDYASSLIRWKGVLVTKQYFVAAMEKMKHILNYPKHLLFIMSSDDLNWCQKHFSHYPNVYFTGKGNSPTLDLAILSSCNHSIFTVGTFGLWSAILTGGEVILAEGFSEIKYTAVMDWPESWLTVRDPCIGNSSYICE